MARIFEAAYLAAHNPRAQSRVAGDGGAGRLRARPIADAIDRDGSFLDIGCATPSA
jgi:hypothetical protein